MAASKRRFPRGKKRGTLTGGRRGPPRRGGARVVDPGLFYALRASVRAVLALYGGEPLDGMGPTLSKLTTWLKEADAWQTDLPVREHESQRGQLHGEVAPDKGNRGGGSQGAVRHVVVPSKKGKTPSWPTDRLSVQMVLNRPIPHEDEPDGEA